MLFSTLGVMPALGSGFEAHHQLAGGDAVVILSDRAWRQHFAADPDIIGRSLTFGTQSRTVVGIMPPGFVTPLGNVAEPDLWIPYVFRAGDRDHAFGGRTYALAVVGRIRPELTVAQARHQIETVTADLRSRYSEDRTWQTGSVSVAPLQDAVLGPARGWLLLALAAVGIVVLLASVNVANLLLARSVRRSGELAVRAALGASASRLQRLVLTEALLVTAAAAGCAVVVTAWMLDASVAVLPAGTAKLSAIALDMRAVLIAAVTALLAAGLAGWAPARQAARVDVMSLLRAATTPRRSRARQLLVASQMAFVVVGGLLASWLITGTLSALVVAIEPTEPVVFGAVILVVVGAAAGAALVPAARAARVDPVVALRAE